MLAKLCGHEVENMDEDARRGVVNQAAALGVESLMEDEQALFLGSICERYYMAVEINA